MQRVVVTGLGLVTPLGCGVQSTWERLLEGESGIAPTEHIDTSDLPVRISGQVPRGSAAHAFRPDEWVKPKDQKKIDDFILYGIAAAKQALEEADWNPQDDASRERTGVLMGAGIGGIERLDHFSRVLAERGARRVSPFFIPGTLINMISGYVSMLYGFRGPNHAVATACATGAHAVGDAARMIMLGDADVMVAGSAEAAVTRLSIAGFAALRALSTNFQDEPTRASRPWDRDRDGFVIAEGAGAMVLESYEHARQRGAAIYAEVVGYGMSGDAYHLTAPSPDGRGAVLAMQGALRSANCNSEAVGYINAHGTSTPLGDMGEHDAVKTVFGAAVDHVLMSSTKSAMGHLLGASGSVEAVISVLALSHGRIPPTLNLDHPEAGCSIDLVPHETRERQLDAVMSNSFGFGGTNASLIFRRC